MVKTIMTIEFNESLSDSSVELIQKILRDSCGFETAILELNEEDE